jgi:hypothetical protein
LEAERQKRGALPVGEESEVADAHEATWQQVKQESAQELLDGQRHEPLLVAMGGISPAESNVVIGESDQPAVGDSHAMCIRSEIAQRVFRSSERPLGIDDPVVAEQDPQPDGKSARFRKRQEVAVELERACKESAAESGDELAAEDAAEYLDGKKEGSA